MTAEDYYSRRLARLIAEERYAAEGFCRSVSAATRAYEKKQRELANRRSELETRSQEPLVEVRRGPGPQPTKYHYVGSGCGWAPIDPEVLYEGEAAARGLKRCSSRFCATATSKPTYS